MALECIAAPLYVNPHEERKAVQKVFCAKELDLLEVLMILFFFFLYFQPKRDLSALSFLAFDVNLRNILPLNFSLVLSPSPNFSLSLSPSFSLFFSLLFSLLRSLVFSPSPL